MPSTDPEQDEQHGGDLGMQRHCNSTEGDMEDGQEEDKDMQLVQPIG